MVVTMAIISIFNTILLQEQCVCERQRARRDTEINKYYLVLRVLEFKPSTFLNITYVGLKSFFISTLYGLPTTSDDTKCVRERQSARRDTKINKYFLVLMVLEFETFTFLNITYVGLKSVFISTLYCLLLPNLN